MIFILIKIIITDTAGFQLHSFVAFSHIQENKKENKRQVK